MRLRYVHCTPTPCRNDEANDGPGETRLFIVETGRFPMSIFIVLRTYKYTRTYYRRYEHIFIGSPPPRLMYRLIFITHVRYYNSLPGQRDRIRA